ncbi:MAG: endolytic transglycosylase MltG [Treponema sp.]|nr:endolytic transglycosylase MltG [Treponema sp.]
MKGKYKTVCIIVFLLALFFAVPFSIVKINTLAVSPGKTDSEKIEVPQGTSVREISWVLERKHLIRSSFVFYMMARFPIVKGIVTGDATPFSLRSGVFKISPSMNLSEILKAFSSDQQEFIRISFPEGLTISKIAHRLADAGVCSAEDFQSASKNKNLLERYGIEASSFEGYLFPDTYFFNPSMEAESVVLLMADNFFKKIKEIPHFPEMNRQELNETVILASIIEREYRIADEAPLIASVFKNRISHNIGLYSCATIEYIITEIEGREHPDVITYADLAINSRYNTYKWAGLPPGAISNPGIIALNAAANPEKTNYYYFRLVDANAGRHVFSRDFSTHINEGYTYSIKK